MQWQHGAFTVNANGSLSLTPIAVDGRQLMSDPCTYDQGIYTRYNQTEYFRVCESRYRVVHLILTYAVLPCLPRPP